jgi:hypothetical protein
MPLDPDNVNGEVTTDRMKHGYLFVIDNDEGVAGLMNARIYPGRKPGPRP